jgi:hypothetical protein
VYLLPWWLADHPALYEMLHRFRRRLLRIMDSTDMLLVDPDEASGTVRRLLGSFFGWRHQGLLGASQEGDRPRPPLRGGGGARGSGARGATIHLTVTVTTQNPGLSLSVAPVYFGTFTYFGAPTTPAVGYVLPGRYQFKATGPLIGGERADQTSYRIPPNLNPTIVTF